MNHNFFPRNPFLTFRISLQGKLLELMLPGFRPPYKQHGFFFFHYRSKGSHALFEIHQSWHRKQLGLCMMRLTPKMNFRCFNANVV